MGVIRSQSKKHPEISVIFFSARLSSILVSILGEPSPFRRWYHTIEMQRARFFSNFADFGDAETSVPADRAQGNNLGTWRSSVPRAGEPRPSTAKKVVRCGSRPGLERSSLPCPAPEKVVRWGTGRGGRPSLPPAGVPAGARSLGPREVPRGRDPGGGRVGFRGGRFPI